MTNLVLNGPLYEYTNFIPSYTKWCEVNVHYGNKQYKVLTALIGKLQLIKPFPKIIKNCQHCDYTKNINKGGYHEFEYEQLFGFENHCSNFNLNKIINISNAI